MIRNWRKDFNRGDFPFLIVQITPYKTMNPEIREAQLIVSKKMNNTALIVITDCGNAEDIHPAKKQTLGERLSLSARNPVYGEEIVYQGPVFQEFEIESNIVILNFSHLGIGLAVRDSDTLKGFTIAGKNKVFIPATAIIKGQ